MLSIKLHKHTEINIHVVSTVIHAIYVIAELFWVFIAVTDCSVMLRSRPDGIEDQPWSTSFNSSSGIFISSLGDKCVDIGVRNHI